MSTFRALSRDICTTTSTYSCYIFLDLAAGPLPFGFHALIFQRLLRAGVFFDIYLLTLRSGCGFGDFHSFGAASRMFAFGGGDFLDWMGMTHAVNELIGLGVGGRCLL